MTALLVIATIAIVAVGLLGFAVLIGRSIHLRDTLADVGDAPDKEQAA